MNLRLVSAASFSLLLYSLAWPLPARAQAQTASNSDVHATPITVQIAPPPISISSAMLGLAGPLGAKSASGKPLFAEFVTEHHQSFTDGNSISHSTTSNIYRDAEGRIRRESQLSLPGIAAGVSAATFITIVDHQLGYGYVLDPQEMVAHRYDLNGAGPSYVARLTAQGNGSALLSPDAKQTTESAANSTSSSDSAGTSHWRQHVFGSHHVRTSPEAGTGIPDSTNSGFISAGVMNPNPGSANSGAADSGTANSGATNSGAANSGAVNSGNHLGSSLLFDDSGAGSTPNMRIDQPFLAAPNLVRTENLGEQNILGFRTLGTRVITTLPAGQIGNDRPIAIVSEQWFSPELELVMRSMHRDPWAGEFTTAVTRVSRGDQPTLLFQVPAAYRVIDAASEGEHHVLDGHGSHSPGPAPW